MPLSRLAVNPVVFVAEATASIVNAMCPDGECEASAEKQLIPTVLAGCWVATLLVGIAFLLLGGCGHLKSTAFLQADSRAATATTRF